ncbi:hypothetical protein D3C81_1758790 [compost metagenome]
MPKLDGPSRLVRMEVPVGGVPRGMSAMVSPPTPVQYSRTIVPVPPPPGPPYTAVVTLSVLLAADSLLAASLAFTVKL